MPEQLQRVKIWSGWFRLTHMAVGVSTIVLLSTGWLIRNAPSVAENSIEIHDITASALILGIVLRLLLAFVGERTERLSSLIPGPSEWRTMREMLLFYITLGRAPLPRWYAHNPFWKPLYLLLYLLLIILAISGALMPERDIVLGWYLPSLHRNLAGIVFWLGLLHVLSVVLHDYRGNTTDSSAIINGYRHFLIEKKSVDVLKQDVASIRPDQIGKRTK